MAEKLRELVVSEWNHNEQDYEEYVIGRNISNEIEKFLQNGYYFSDLGDAVVLAMAKKINIPILAFSSILHYPLILTNPRHSEIPILLCIAFNHYTAGHYDAVKDTDHQRTLTIPTLSKRQPGTGCSCGKNNGKSSCLTLKTKYTEIVRCPCLKKKFGCTATCRCKNCENPKGIKPKLNQSAGSRERSRHLRQSQCQRVGSLH